MADRGSDRLLAVRRAERKTGPTPHLFRSGRPVHAGAPSLLSFAASGRAGLDGIVAHASQTGLGVTFRTGLLPGSYQVAVRIPTAGEAAFSKITPVGIFTAWQRLTGQQYTARGVLDLATGAFTRTGMNLNQAAIYGVDAAGTGIVVGGVFYFR